MYLLNFSRGVPATGRFILLTERMAIDMRQWYAFWIIDLAGVSYRGLEWEPRC